MDENHKQEFVIPVDQHWRELDDSPPILNEDERAFLRRIIGDDDDKVKERVEAVRKSAFSRYPYPCIRRYHFINLMMMQNPIYLAVVEAGRKGTTWLLDIGCCMGTDTRKLVIDGYPAVNIAGCDLRSFFMEIGENELFRDAGNCEITFFSADIFEFSPSSSLGSDGWSLSHDYPRSLRDVVRSSESGVTNLDLLKGRLTHIYAGALFHLFGESTQYGIALRMASLLRSAPGSIIFGRHEGKEEAGDLDDGVIGATTFRYGHSTSTWMQMWKRVYEELVSVEFAKEHVNAQAQFVVDRTGLVDNWLMWSVSLV